MRVATFDLEGDNLYPEVTTIWCGCVKDHETGDIKSYFGDGLADLCSDLASYDVLIGHNSIYYDFPALRKLYGWEYKGIKVDTLQMSRLQRPNRSLPPNCPKWDSHGERTTPHSVAAWAYRIGEERKIEHEDWSQFSEEMLARCKRDVEIQYGIYEALLEEGAGECWAEAHKLNHKLFHYLQLQEDYGWLVDRPHIERCLAELDRWIGRIDRSITPRLPLITEKGESKKDGEYNWLKKPFKKDGSLSEAASNYLGEDGDNLGGPFSRVGFRPTNPNSNAELKAYLLSVGWEPTEWNTNNDGQRTSPKLSKDDEFVGVQGSLGRLLVRRVKCTHRRSVLEGWLAAIRPDGRIGAKVNGVANTGRLKHSVIVNVPSPDAKSFYAKQMRACFIVKPGWVLVGTDSKSNQMRQLANRMAWEFPPGDEEFTYAVLHGNKDDETDLHSLNRKRSGVATRTLAKNFFYGCILFGAGNAKTAKVTGKTVEGAKQLKEEYFQQMPMLRQLLDRLTEEWRKTAKRYWNKRFNRWEYSHGFITGLDGRPIQVEFEKDILVYYLQSDEAIQMASAYCVLHKWLEREGYRYGQDFGFVIWMHDEFQIEAREEIAKHVAALAEESIAWAGRYFKMVIPHEGESKIGQNWAETH